MRTICGHSPLEMTSPVRFIMLHVPAAIVNIAPEREVEFDTVYPEFTLEYINDRRWICEVDVSKKHVHLSTGVCEILWCAAYAYVSLYTQIESDRKLASGTVIEFKDFPELDRAVRLLRWAFECWINREASEWPYDCPKPIPNPAHGTMERSADEFCLCAIAFLIHHELSHVRLGHTNSEYSLEDEREADYSAIDWIIPENLEEDSPVFKKRYLGALLALGVTTAHGIHTGRYGGITHPRSYDRLINILSRHTTDSDHLVWAMASVLLKLHLDSASIEVPKTIHSDFRSCVEEYANILSRNSSEAS